MKRTLAVLALGASLLAAPAMAADNVVSAAFKMTCSATGGAMAPAMAAADAAGWAEIPSSLMADSMAQSSGLKVQEIGSRAMVQDRKLLIMIAGVANTNEASSVMEMSLCAVATFGAVGDELKADMTRQLGSSPIKSPADLAEFSVWLYVEGPKGREFLDSMSSRKAMRAVLDGKLHMVMVGEDKGEGMSMIMEMRPVLGEKN